MSLLDTIRRALSGQEPEVRCDCLRCLQHRVPSLRGRTFSPEEWSALHAPAQLAQQAQAEPWPQAVTDAEKAADDALESYTSAEIVWLDEVRAAQDRYARGYRGTDLNDRRNAARGLLDEAGEKLSQARARHSALIRKIEIRRRLEAGAAALAESEAEVQELRRSRWLELLGR